MLSRRIIRAKAMQTLYSDAIGKDISPVVLEKALLESILAAKKLYYVYLMYLVEVCNYSIVHSAKQATKLLDENKNTTISTKIVNNSIIKLISNNKDYKDFIAFNKLHTIVNKQVVKTLFLKLIEKERYLNYIDKKITTEEDDKDILRYIIKKVMGSSQLLDDDVADYFINIEDDQFYALISLQKILKTFESKQESLFLRKFLLLEENNDLIKFAKDLIAKFYDHQEDLISIIKPRLKNWDIERIAVLDIVILKMAICEMKYFSSIPVKVTINEYIDLTKEYSTDKSKDFVNGMLDRIKTDLTNSKEINKQGRGLIN